MFDIERYGTVRARARQLLEQLALGRDGWRARTIRKVKETFALMASSDDVKVALSRAKRECGYLFVSRALCYLNTSRSFLEWTKYDINHVLVIEGTNEFASLMWKVNNDDGEILER